jgi:hypothetical protein
MIAVQVKILPPTDTKGSRIKARLHLGRGEAVTKTEHREYEKSVVEQVEQVAQRLIALEVHEGGHLEGCYFGKPLVVQLEHGWVVVFRSDRAGGGFYS